MKSHVLEASRLNLPPCPACDALRGDPCRTPNYATRKPHEARWAKNAAIVAAERKP